MGRNRSGLIFFVSVLVVSSAFAKDLAVDFDGKNSEPKEIGSSLESAIKNDIGIPLVPRSNEVGGGGIAGLKVVEQSESGEKIIRMDSLSGKSHGEFQPNINYYYEHTCSGGQAQLPWGVCLYYEFLPEVAGHAHKPPESLTLAGQDGKVIPNPYCVKNLKPKVPHRINVRAPVFATRISVKATFSGGCKGTVVGETDVKVTANDVIQLAELLPEPYFDIKQSDGGHPVNRYATPDTIAKLKQISWEFYEQFHLSDKQKFTVTDMGLAWGGRFRWDSPWNCWEDGASHQFHRYGRQVDVRSSNMTTPEMRACFEAIACKYQVEPILERTSGSSPSVRDFSKLSAAGIDALDRVEHYHLNFTRPTDPPVNPADDSRTRCAGSPPPESVCPNPS